MTTMTSLGYLPPTPRQVGDRVTGRCTTNWTVHTGPVVGVQVAQQYANGTVAQWRYSITCDRTGRSIVLAVGSDRLAS
jgi:hypothetical protein